MDKRTMIIVFGLFAALSVSAVQLDAEVMQETAKLVEEAMRSHKEDYTAGRITAAEFAAQHTNLLAKVVSGAGEQKIEEKYVLLQAALRIYMRAGLYEEAVDTIYNLHRTIHGLPPQVLVEVLGNEKKALEASDRLNAFYQAARRTVEAETRLKAVESKLKDAPDDKALNREYALCQVELGNWPLAREAFIKAGGREGEIAYGEKRCTIKDREIGDYWWTYEDTREMTPFKLLAARSYRRAFALDREFTGLKREVAEERVKAAEAQAMLFPALILPKMEPLPADARVFELSDTERLEMIHFAPAEYEFAPENGGWGGPESMRHPNYIHKIGFSNEFWVLRVPFTRAQAWALWDDKTQKSARREGIGDVMSCDTRFDSDAPEIFERLNKRFADQIPEGYVFRCPTFAEWIYIFQKEDENAPVSREPGLHWGEHREMDPAYAIDSIERMYRSTFEQFGIRADWNAYPTWLTAPRQSGVYEMCVGMGEKLLDRFPWCTEDGGSASWDWAEKGEVMKEFHDVDPDVAQMDPLCLYGHYPMLKGHWWGTFQTEAYPSAGIRHIVLGIDLEKRHREAVAKAEAAKLDTFKLENPIGSITKLKFCEAKNDPYCTELAIDFALCPAGEFTMGYTDAVDVAACRDVKITRPFWFSTRHVKFPVAELFNNDVREEFSKLSWLPSIWPGEKFRHEVAMWSWGTPLRSRVDTIIAEFQRRYGSMLPEGYVFRLPTEAEYEYVSKSGGKDDSFNADSSKIRYNISWGIKEMNYSFGFEWLADRLPKAENAMAVTVSGDNRRIITRLDYSGIATEDPCMKYDGEDAATLCRGRVERAGTGVKYLIADDDQENVGGFFHIVVGPAL